MSARGRWINLNDGREVNLHTSKSFSCAVYLSRGKQVPVQDPDRFGPNAVWVQMDTPRRKTIAVNDPANRRHGETVNVYPGALFYTKEYRQWTLCWIDDNGDQVGPAVYANTKAELWRIIRDEAKPYKAT